ncbi:hypothetical protein [Campylobacter sp.]|uniref:hypothetical protein n=1 Tax=Campylobacter sp. TaxID=205 RepID=UPI002AA79DFB|nr:hypothetical protein [Campylobacter sp.]MCI7582585.1 hypothetical protein [Campylobacter sp.]
MSKSRISKQNLEFLRINSRIPKPCVIPRLDFFVIPQLDRGISSNRRHCEGAISLLFTAVASQKHCASLGNSRIP